MSSYGKVKSVSGKKNSETATETNNLTQQMYEYQLNTASTIVSRGSDDKLCCFYIVPIIRLDKRHLVVHMLYNVHLLLTISEVIGAESNCLFPPSVDLLEHIRIDA